MAERAGPACMLLLRPGPVLAVGGGAPFIRVQQRARRACGRRRGQRGSLMPTRLVSRQSPRLLCFAFSWRAWARAAAAAIITRRWGFNNCLLLAGPLPLMSGQSGQPSSACMARLLSRPAQRR